MFIMRKEKTMKEHKSMLDSLLDSLTNETKEIDSNELAKQFINTIYSENMNLTYSRS